MASNIDELASTISRSVSRVSTYLTENSLPFPSFAADGPISLGIKSPEVEQSRHTAINALQELLDLLRGPLDCMIPNWNATPHLVIHRYDLARKVPLEGKISFQELASQCGLHTVDLRRIIRHAISYCHLFSEPEIGFVAHSAGSKLLAQDEMLRAGVGQAFNEFYPAYARTADALDKYKDQEPNHTGFALAHETNQSLFEYLGSHPVKADQFSKAMTCFSRDIEGYSVSYLTSGYDWQSLGSGTLVDVGGADGQVATAIAQAFPDINVVVQDLPGVITAVESKPDRSKMPSTVNFQAHDFFTPQPTTADAYLYRWVFHDWPDHYVVRALQQLVPALKPGARVIVNESLSPEPGSLPVTIERLIRHLDLLMLTINNARLRTVPEWQEIFNSADSRFGPVKLTFPKGAALAILEVIWQGKNQSNGLHN